MVRDIDGHDIITMGCIDTHERSQLNCHVGSQTNVAIECCDSASFCNRLLLPRYVTDDSASAHHYHLATDNAGVSSEGQWLWPVPPQFTPGPQFRSCQ